jgi:antitoxin component YwqK of YwqJK toxin-antitoxin module
VRGRYRNDKADGTWRYYDTDGREIDKKRFDSGVEKN